MSDRVVVMNQGRIEQEGVPREIYDAPATHFVADFIGETNFIRQGGRVVAVRPERIRLARASVAASPGVPGEVVTTMVVGPGVQCLVRLDDGQEVLVRQQRTKDEAGTETLREGERVTVMWTEDDALLLETSEEVE